MKLLVKKESNTKQILYVKADGEICGALSIHPNIPAYQKKIKVVFVKVTTDINGVPVEGSSIDGGKEFFIQNFKQALVISDIVEDKLDCRGDELKNKFCTYEKL